MIIQGLAINGMTVSSSAATISTDTYFNLVTLLLPGTGTNGAQNNTFLDSSTNNFTVTRNGNTTQGTFSPFSQTGWSNYFDGSDSLTVPTGTFSYTAGVAFTFECFVYRVSTTGSSSLAQLVVGTAVGGTSLSVYITNTGEIKYGQANVADILSSAAGIIKLNQWHHIAIGKNSSNQVRMWVDGNSVATGTDNTNYATGSMYIGRNVANTQNLDGYISNLRSVTGSDVYGYGNSSITVPTTPLTAITNTQLLTCQSNRFVDNSSNAFAITVAGNTSVQAFAPFDPTAAYSAATVGGSGYFDGSGDYLSVPTSNSLMHQIGDWTYEGWIFWNVMPSAGYQNVFGQGAAGQNSFGLTAYNGTSWSAPYKFVVTQANIGNRITGTTTLVAGTWYHFAVVRNSGVITLYVNGTAEGTYSNSTDYAFGGNPFTIGDSSNGYISNFRFNRSAVYTSAFTPPTAPVTAIANTQLLLNFTNGGIIDATAKNVAETVGGAAISTAQSKFGGSSMLFDGNGDYLQMTSPSRLLINWWSQDFTIEGWIYPTTLTNTSYNQGGNQTPTLIGNMSPSTDGNYWSFGPITNGTLRLYYYNGSSIFPATSTETVTINQWNHIAVTNVAGVGFKYWVNGIGSSNITVSGTPLAGPELPLLIGWKYYSTGSAGFTGYINDLRITTGLARYTSNFTPPTQAFPTQ